MKRFPLYRLVVPAFIVVMIPADGAPWPEAVVGTVVGTFADVPASVTVPEVKTIEAAPLVLEKARAAAGLLEGLGFTLTEAQRPPSDPGPSAGRTDQREPQVDGEKRSQLACRMAGAKRQSRGDEPERSEGRLPRGSSKGGAWQHKRGNY